MTDISGSSPYFNRENRISLEKKVMKKGAVTLNAIFKFSLGTIHL